ncbi:E3 ubiquitin-protein ligase TRAIP isoform X2 [Cephus cinctus]|uniref:E3 ubiquitin-protein ligase TRAIP isoform X2 n=1 Tax=Cephus cinctus TaxID=211228 RepID=A0AAJ7VYH5_CEPCN|nr:E3 ubiquitin-protein ligase TRAIP isoform X2 [Cephus cinctus]
MKITCVICCDPLTPSDDVFYTPCGHVFHFSCIVKWLERSKSCPQCREKVTETKIHRIYFNYSDTNVPVESSSSLQERVENLKFQIMLKENDIKHYTSKAATLEHQTSGLRKEVRKLESEMLQKDSAIYALQKQINYLKQQNEEAEAAKKQAAVLKRKLEELRSVQVILDAPAEEVDEIIANTKNPASLATYICVIKRELTSSSNKCRELRTTAKKLQQDLTKVSLERNFLNDEHSKRMQLQEDYAICESEKMALQQKCAELEAVISNCSSFNKSNDSNRLSIESNTQREDTSRISLSSSVEKKNSDDSVIFVSTRVIPEDITYNGFGGHSKSDNFPTSSSGTKQKKLNDFRKSKKLKLDN